MSKISLTEHGTSLSTAVRKDVTSFFRDCVTETMDLYEKSKEVLLEKGLYVRSPYIPIPKKVDFVKEQSFIRGFLGEKDRSPVKKSLPCIPIYKKILLGFVH